jgi:hypothetical protein
MMDLVLIQLVRLVHHILRTSALDLFQLVFVQHNGPLVLLQVMDGDLQEILVIMLLLVWEILLLKVLLLG